MEDAALPAFAIRVFTSSAPSFGIHVEEEVYNRYARKVHRFRSLHVQL